MQKFTQSYIDKLKPTGAEYEISLGFRLFVVVSAKGVKSYRYKYTNLTTKARKKKNIASADAMKLEQALEMAFSFNRLLENGLDPFAKMTDTSNHIKSKTLRDIVDDWRQIKGQHLSQKHLRDRMARFNNHLFPILGDFSIAEITLFKARELIKPIYDKAPHMGEKIARDLREMGDHAVEMGILENNHLSLIKNSFPRPKAINNPCIKAEELPQFLQDLSLSKMDLQTRFLIEFQLLTMVRANEVVTAEWAHIDFKNACWNIPPENMKMKRAHAVPLSKQALDILQEQQKYSGHLRYIFPNRRDKNKHYSPNTANQAFYRALGYKDRMTPHGMRSLASTYLEDIGAESLEVIDACLAHCKKEATTKAYLRSNYYERRIKVMQLWGDYVEQCKKA